MLFGFDVSSIIQIIFMDLILSGDNAILIALAVRNVPKEKQKMALSLGIGVAIGLRIIFAFGMIWLLKIPLISFVGGLLLLIVAYKLMCHNDHSSHSGINGGGTTVSSAIKTILFGDVLMSLDNVLVLTGITHNMTLIMFGIAVSIPIIIWGSKFLMTLMKKYPIVIYIGAGILGFTSGEMIIKDSIIASFLNSHVAHSLPIILSTMVISIGFLKDQKIRSYLKSRVVKLKGLMQ